MRRPYAPYCMLCLVALALSMVALSLSGCGSPSSDEPLSSDPADYEDPDYAPKTDEPAGAVATVDLRGYSFGPGSHKINHRYLTARPSTSDWEFEPLGEYRGESPMRVRFSYGGTVRGVNTLRMFTRRRHGACSGSSVVSKVLRWVAEDRLGNVHVLKEKVLEDGSGGSSPERRVGVATKGGVFLLLAREADLTVGYRWRNKIDHECVESHKVISTTAQGRERLRLRSIFSCWDRAAGDAVDGEDLDYSYWETRGLVMLVDQEEPFAGWLMRGTVTGRVMGLDGGSLEPVPDLRITWAWLETRTDTLGRFSLDDVPVGTYTLWVHTQREVQNPGVLKGSVAAGETVDIGDVRLGEASPPPIPTGL